jgi:hypothetical protein
MTRIIRSAACFAAGVGASWLRRGRFGIISLEVCEESQAQGFVPW